MIVEFDRGTLLLRGHPDGPTPADLPACKFDPRVSEWRAPARHYRSILEALGESGTEVEDLASSYEDLELVSHLEREPFPYQTESVEAWWEEGGRGVVVLPTGAGKTFVAQMAMLRTQCSTLIVTPTIDLMNQWYAVLSTSFDINVGLLGGGYHEIQDVTVTTYDSAYMHVERLGNRFGLIVFDECHHLPGPSYQLAAECSLAPYRLGLTATPEREDRKDIDLDHLIGKIVFRKQISELAGSYLADYETFKVGVPLSPAERDEYQTARTNYIDFLRENNIQMGSPSGWSYFLRMTTKSPRGREALLAYQKQKSIAQGADAKIRYLERIIASHHGDRVIIFTSDNETVYKISRRFLIPTITHQTKIKERRETLERFNAGDYPFIVTSRVLNEGVDVPAANVAVILSGTGSVREHVQRLGRILRRAKDKQAVLYELVTEETGEESVSTRRRRHDAYR